ncbi:hypothetical protein BDF22DRAFT_673876 [Syncephalis plumigaleata]|nr:hypothetical protein BDF22DRAFT_673876 [Syncephalis plumigaleata]
MLDVASEDDREALLNNKSNTIAHEPNAVLATTEHGMERKSTEDANAHDEDIEVETDANAKQASVVRTPSLIETTANAIMRFATSWQGTPETTEENSAIATPSDALSTNVDETSKPIANANIDTNTTTVSTSVPPIIEKELPANPENEQGLLEEEANTTTANNEDDDTNTEMKAASSTTHKASGFSTRGFGGKLKRISINAFTKMRSRDTSTSSSTGSNKMDQSTKNALNEAADQLNERAANFAELAKQIAEREKNRKWYEF